MCGSRAAWKRRGCRRRKACRRKRNRDWKCTRAITTRSCPRSGSLRKDFAPAPTAGRGAKTELSDRFVSGDPLHAVTFPVLQLDLQVGHLAHAADLLLDVEQGSLDAQFLFEMIVLLAPGLVVEHHEIAFDVDGGPDNLHIELLGVNIVAHQNALHHPENSQFLERHTATAPSARGAANESSVTLRQACGKTEIRDSGLGS